MSISKHEKLQKLVALTVNLWPSIIHILRRWDRSVLHTLIHLLPVFMRCCSFKGLCINKRVSCRGTTCYFRHCGCTPPALQLFSRNIPEFYLNILFWLITCSITLNIVLLKVYQQAKNPGLQTFSGNKLSNSRWSLRFMYLFIAILDAPWMKSKKPEKIPHCLQNLVQIGGFNLTEAVKWETIVD